MAIPTMDDDLNIIGGLGDNPNTDNNMTAAELKAAFDKAPKLIQNFINTTIVPALNNSSGGGGGNGASAYEIAVANGFEGTEAEWLESLKGEDGEPGEDGYTPVKGTDYYTEEEQEEMVEAVLAELPISVDEDGYTDIEGLRQAINIDFVKDGNTITGTVTLQGDETISLEMTLGDDGYPSSIVTNGVECSLGFTGFETTEDSGEEDTGDTEDETGRTYFYNAGDVCESITGGWTLADDRGTLTMGEDAMTIFGVAENVYCELSLRTANKIDLTDYSKISFKLLYTGLIDSEYAAVGVTTSDTFSSKSSFAASTVIEESTEVVTYEVDVSALTGERYIALFGYSGLAAGTGYTVHQVWGE